MTQKEEGGLFESALIGFLLLLLFFCYRAWLAIIVFSNYQYTKNSKP